MKSEWIKTVDRLPEYGQKVNIKVLGGGDVIRKGVLFDAGIFWKMRKGQHAGHSWGAIEWQPIEEKVGKKPKHENTAMDYEYESRD